VPDVGLLEYPGGHPAPTCGTGIGRRSSVTNQPRHAGRI
jgi:hypothetical protein